MFDLYRKSDETRDRTNVQSRRECWIQGRRKCRVQGRVRDVRVEIGGRPSGVLQINICQLWMSILSIGQPMGIHVFAYNSWVEGGLKCRKASFPDSTRSTSVAAILSVTKLSASNSSIGFFASCISCESRSHKGVVEIFSKKHDD